MNVLMLCYKDEPLREFPLGRRTLEVGSGAGCDIVVHDPRVRERQLLLISRGGTVVVHDLESKRSRSLPPNQPLPIGRHHSIVRIPDATTGPLRLGHRTEQLLQSSEVGPDLTLVIGRSKDARRVPLDARPVAIGTRDDNDVVLADRTVSGLHCRLEPSDEGLRIRDLGSRNGTFVDGVPVTLAQVGAGSSIRVGRTDLRLVSRGRPPGASSSALVAASPAMRDVLAQVERYAQKSYPALLLGESGSGKELLARALHAEGPRAKGPFVAINAGGVPASLIESELFGHERGAFTDAASERRGLFEQAHGGTLFLDEIGELPLELQSRLLRVLETWTVRRVGGERTIRVDVRLVSATHRDLRRMVTEGRFREDLYFRMARLVVKVPPLRERPEDVDALAERFLADAAEQNGSKRFGDGALAYLRTYAWPGNARELRNVIEQAAVDCAGAWITRDDVARVLASVGDPRYDLDAAHMEAMVAQHGGNLAAAARALGVPRTTLRDRLGARRPKKSA